MKLNLGCSDRAIEGFIGVDIAPGPCVDQVVDLEAPWPWEDASVEEVKAHDVAEHIGDCQHFRYGCTTCLVQGATDKLRHPLGRIHFLNELHRVLAPGGRALVEVPSAAHGVGFVCDPTHKTPWCLSSFKYFEHGSFAHTRLGKSYGITAAFRVLNLHEYECSGEDGRERVWKIIAELEAVK